MWPADQLNTRRKEREEKHMEKYKCVKRNIIKEIRDITKENGEEMRGVICLCPTIVESPLGGTTRIRFLTDIL